MNLNRNPTIDQLRDLVSRCDDSAGAHVVWVNQQGEVAVARVLEDQTEADFEQAHPDVQVRSEMFLPGNAYVGPEAAADIDWMTELFDNLNRKWQESSGKKQIAYLDRV